MELLKEYGQFKAGDIVNMDWNLMRWKIHGFMPRTSTLKTTDKEQTVGMDAHCERIDCRNQTFVTCDVSEIKILFFREE